MRKQDLVIGLAVIQGCFPSIERDDSNSQHFSGVQWQFDEEGNVMSTRTVLVERIEAGDGRVIGSDAVVPLTGSVRGGVLRVIDDRAPGRSVFDLTPLGDEEFDARLRLIERNRSR